MQQQINLKDLSILELKGIFFDFLRQKEYAEGVLSAVTQEIKLKEEEQQKTEEESK